MLILRRSDVLAVLDDADETVCRTVSETYVAHARHRTSVPHSVFLRFPDDPGSRIIALPAFVADPRPVAAVKWVASFPENISRGQERASAVILLNSVADGRPVAVVEGSIISARRTAASAAVAASVLTAGAGEAVRGGVSLIGCGVINLEVLRFLRSRLPRLSRVALFDLDPDRAGTFAGQVSGRWPELHVDICRTVAEAMAAHRIVSLATTATRPHLTTDACQPGSVLLHLSLRDLAPESIIGARNVVDDADHVCRAATSLELAQQHTGDRSFISAELGDLLAGSHQLPYRADSLVVFSPFGLGALDAAVAARVVDTAIARGIGLHVPDFVTEEQKESHAV